MVATIQRSNDRARNKRLLLERERENARAFQLKRWIPEKQRASERLLGDEVSVRVRASAGMLASSGNGTPLDHSSLATVH